METVATASSPRPMPRPPTLIGREYQETRIRELFLGEGRRLVTLIGAGGIGKTSLALRVAADLRSEFAGGVGFVALAAIVDPALVVSTIARALAIPERAAGAPGEALADALRERDFLLVLDNFEQVLEAATEVADLLEVCDRLKILVTSRAPLRIREEQEFPVPPLKLPDGNVGAAESPAVALFVARARGVDPVFALTDGNLPAVVEICRRLDGLPLAIELAAARSKVLPPTAMASRLDRRLPLLTGGPRDAPARQRTLRSTIAWSYDLLSEDDRTLFRRLCVFSGGGTLHAIESICAESDSPGSVLDGLAALVDSSLLWQAQQEDGEPRFRMLETVREFGVNQLEARGEDREIEARHAAYFLSLAEAASMRLRGAERTAWLDRLEREHDNLRSALTWFRAEGNAVDALRLAAALWQFWWWRSHFAEGRLRLGEVLAMPGAAAPTAERARALTGLGVLTETQGEVAAADVFHAESVEIWKGLGNASGLAYSLIFRWLIALNHDDQEAMTRFAEESLDLFRKVDDAWGIAMSHMELGIGAMRRYDPKAIELLTGGRRMFREIKDAWGDAICTGVLGNVALTQGQVAQALPLLRQSLGTLLELNDQWGVATFLPATARMEADLGRWERCVVLSAAVEALGNAIGAPLKSPFLQRFKDNLARANQALKPGMYETAWAAGLTMSAGEAVAFAFALAPEDDKLEHVVPSRPVAPAAAAGLTPREIEVLRLADRTAREIADTLFVSPSTIVTHLDNIRGKLGLDSKSALSAYAARHGYL